MQSAFGIGFDALAYGMVLFVISVGLSVTLGLMRVVNLAHGAFAMVGGYIAVTVLRDVGLGFGSALLAAVAGTIVIALPIERVLLRPLYGGARPMAQVLMTIGLTFAAIGAANALFGSSLRTVTLPSWLAGRVDLGFRVVAAHRVFAIVCGAVVALGLWLLFTRTRFGIHLRATVDNSPMAACLGIQTGRVYAISFSVGVGLAAFGGVIGAQMLPIDPYYALRYMTVFLVVASVGGAGSIGGALAASLLLGLLHTLGQYLLSGYGDLFFYAGVIAIVATFPHGLIAPSRASIQLATQARVRRLGSRVSFRGELGRVAAIGAACLAAGLLLPDELGFLTRIAVMGLLVLSVDLVVGYCGVSTIGHAAIFGVGAYATGIACVHGITNPLALLVVGGGAGAMAGLACGVLLARAEGLPQLVLSIAFLELVQEAANKLSFLTGGSDGLSGIEPAPVLGRFAFDIWGHTQGNRVNALRGE